MALFEHIEGNQFRLVTEAKKSKLKPNWDHLTISKKEEAYAFDFLKRFIVPIVVKNWNRIYPSIWELTEDEVRKTIRKVSEEEVYRKKYVTDILKTKFGKQFKNTQLVFFINKSPSNFSVSYAGPGTHLSSFPVGDMNYLKNNS